MSATAGGPVLVTGATGFVGSTLVRQLLAGEAEVVAVDNFFSGPKSNLAQVADRIELIECDVLDSSRLDEIFRRHAPRYVYHLVGDTFVPSAYHLPGRFVQINIEAALSVLQSAARAGVQRMLYVSSTEVYGCAPRLPIAEDAPLNPVNTYAVTKLAADRLCYTFAREHRFPVVIARIFNCFGPRETQPYIVPEVIRQLAHSDTVQLGNVDVARDFTYVEDTARGLMAVMNGPFDNGSAVNVGTGRSISLRELVDTCARLMDRTDYRIDVDPRRQRRVEIEDFRCDPTRIHRATKWQPRVDIEEGLRRTIAWYREHGNRWTWEDWCPDGVVQSDPLGEAAELRRAS